MDVLFLIGRILFGGFFLMMGVNHYTKTEMFTGYAAKRGINNPKFAVWVTGALLVLGGLGVMLGVLTDLALLFLMIFLIGVSFKMHAFWKISDPEEKAKEMSNFMKNMALLGAVFMLYIIADWPLSLM